MNEQAECNEAGKKVLSKFFDPYLLELLRNPVVLEIRNVCMTVVFWDVSNFSRLCNKLNRDEEAITGFLREYFIEAAKVIYRHRGILDKSIGDGKFSICLQSI